ncbi:MAG: CsbD family protein [Cyanobacteriota bacterium]
MSIENRIEAAAKNIEGKIQEAVGELTGDAKQKLEGQAKQAEASAQHAKEDVKDAVKEGIDNLLG